MCTSLSTGLLTASVVSLYCMYLCWSALSSYPYVECNPLLKDSKNGSTVVGLFISTFTLSYSAFSIASSSDHSYTYDGGDDDDDDDDGGEEEGYIHDEENSSLLLDDTTRIMSHPSVSLSSSTRRKTTSRRTHHINTLTNIDSRSTIKDRFFFHCIMGLG